MRLPGSSPTAEAIRHAFSHREGLVQFLAHGKVEVDTNTVERAVRPFALAARMRCSPPATMSGPTGRHGLVGGGLQTAALTRSATSPTY